MAVIKNKKTNTYEVRTYYKDWTGVRKQKTRVILDDHSSGQEKPERNGIILLK